MTMCAGSARVFFSSPRLQKWDLTDETSFPAKINELPILRYLSLSSGMIWEKNKQRQRRNNGKNGIWKQPQIEMSVFFLLNEDIDERISQKGSLIYKSKWVSFVFA